MKVFWTAEARTRLLEIQTYIAQSSPAIARQVVLQLLKRSRQLANPPLIGRRMPEYPDDEIRELLERPYRIIYRVTPSQIEIVTLKHYRQRLPHNPQRLTTP